MGGQTTTGAPRAPTRGREAPSRADSRLPTTKLADWNCLLLPERSVCA